MHECKSSINRQMHSRRPPARERKPDLGTLIGLKFESTTKLAVGFKKMGLNICAWEVSPSLQEVL